MPLPPPPPPLQPPPPPLAPPSQALQGVVMPPLPPPLMATRHPPQIVHYDNSHLDIYPASALAMGLGVKGLLYSQPGAGKTPMMLSLPDSMACITEPGIRSIAKTTFPCFEAYTHKAFVDFVNWMCGSREARLYHGFFIDSISQACETHVEQMQVEYAHGKKAYGELFKEMYPLIRRIYYAPNVNVVMFAKQDFVQVNGTTLFRPMFPGQALPIAVPHLFDSILRLEIQTNGQKMVRTVASFDAVARDRSGNLLPLEQPDFATIFRKILS